MTLNSWQTPSLSLPSAVITCVSRHTPGIKCLQRLCYRLGTLMWTVESKLACGVAIPKEIGLLKQKGLQMLKTAGKGRRCCQLVWPLAKPTARRYGLLSFFYIFLVLIFYVWLLGVLLQTQYTTWKFCFGLVFWDRICLGAQCVGPGWPGPHSDPPVAASRVLGLKMWAITPQCQQFFKTFFIGVYENI